MRPFGNLCKAGRRRDGQIAGLRYAFRFVVPTDVRHGARAEPDRPRLTRLAVVMDPIEDIKYAKDSTLAMLLAGERRGHACTT
jgi:hypothetical protein